MVETRSRKRGTGEVDGITRATRSTRNTALIDNEPSALPKAKRQRTAVSSTNNARASRATRALKPVETNAKAGKATRGSKSNAKTQSNDVKLVAKKPRGRPRKQPQQQQTLHEQVETHEQQPQPIEALSSAGATHAGADNADTVVSISQANQSKAKIEHAITFEEPNPLPTNNDIQSTRSYQDGKPYDIDARDRNDPLAVTDYVEDMYKHFMRKEGESSVNRMYMGRAEENKQPNINESMRCILVDWLIEVHYKFKLFPETLYLTINILDRYLSHTHEIITKRDLQLVGVTSLLVAAKYEEMYVPELRDLTYICDGAYTEAKILRMEEKILKTLRYNVTVPTPHTFLVRYLKAAKADKLMAQLASFLLDGTLLSLEEFTCRWKPSQMAAAAILLARRQVGRHNWSPTLVAYSSYREEMILPVAKALLEQKHRLERNRELMALAKKYSKTKYGKVSHIAFLPLEESDYETSGDDSMQDSEL